MANLLLSTEALEDTGNWTASNITVTANTHAAPGFAGVNAGMADTVADNSAAAGGLLTANYVDIAADSSDYVGSVYIRKDAVTTRWPDIFIQISGVVTGFVSLNTSTGSIANGSGPLPAATDIVNVDAFWWRLWMQVANTGSAAIIRMGVYPDHLDALGGATTSPPTGSVVLWGFNITKSSAVQDYEPEPFYAFVAPRSFLLVR